MKSDTKVLNAIKATEDWLNNCKDKRYFTEHSSCTIYYCETRNLGEYKQMLGIDKRKLTGRLRELYKAI